MQNIQKTIELFHLLFLRQLEKKIDKKLYALKGGCNLRFFFKSIRYSEDIDFDVAIIAKTTLKNKVDKILSDSSFQRILQSKGIESIQSSSTKQTETTQRWKVQLNIKGSTIPIPTKIEFSRRTKELDPGVVYAALDKDVINQHNEYPIMCNHYNHEAAYLQKINALINRTETQARDIFDLKLLLDQAAKMIPLPFSKEELNQAVQNAQGIDFAIYKSQVVAYLMDEYKLIYDSEEHWNALRLSVISVLKEAQDAAH